ncbi:MAG TPA: hypothetical protein VM243_14170 [Phycisphaerae bacterium]|nr:hypothetical protein [Phycisphaerae bacterium]
MREVGPAIKLVLLLAVLTAIGLPDTAYAKKPGGGGDDDCPRDIMCPAYWDPVICDDGQTYSNACYAYAACATGCESMGQGPIILDRGDCPRDILCPDYWDPVIC